MSWKKKKEGNAQKSFSNKFAQNKVILWRLQLVKLLNRHLQELYFFFKVIA